MKNTIIINNVSVNVFEITKLLKENRKIQAVKYVFDKAKIGLKEAKDIIEKIESGDYE